MLRLHSLLTWTLFLNMSAVLSIKNLSYTYKACQGESDYTVRLAGLDLNAGEVVAVLGVSGCGKSTLLECMGFIREGFSCESYNLSGYALEKMSEKERLFIRSSMMGFMPQSSALINYLDVEDNLKLQIETAAASRYRLLKKRTDTKLQLKKAKESLEEFHLIEFLKRKPSSLSTGQRQRVAFFKSICHEPVLSLIDEPTSALDPEHGQMLFENMIDACRVSGVCAVVVTHDLSLVEKNSLPSLNYRAVCQGTGEFA